MYNKLINNNSNDFVLPLVDNSTALKNEESLNEASLSLLELKLPIEILDLIGRNLDAKSLSRAALVCRRFYQVFSSDYLWRWVIERDFGKEVKQKAVAEREALPENEKQSFKAIYHNKKAEAFIRNLPNGESLLKRANSSQDNFSTIYRLVPVSYFNEYIDNLSDEELRRVWKESVLSGYSEILKVILNGARSGSIKAEYLGDSLYNAAENGHKEIVVFLLGCSRSGDIKAEKLRWALMDSAKNGHKEIVAYLLGCSRSDDIIAGNLGWALMSAAKNGHKEIVAFLLGCSRSGDIEALFLEEAVRGAAENGHKEIEALLNRKIGERAKKESL